MIVDGLSEIFGLPYPGRDAQRALHDGFVWTLLPRHGQRPARFLGRSLLRVDNRAALDDLRMPFWSEMHAFELFGGGFAVCVRHLRADDDRARYQHVWHAAGGAEIIATLWAHDCAACLEGGLAQDVRAISRQAWRDLLAAVFDEAAAA